MKHTHKFILDAVMAIILVLQNNAAIFINSLLLCLHNRRRSGCLCPQMDTYDTAQVCQLIILLSAHSIWCTAITLPICCAFSKIKGHAAG